MTTRKRSSSSCSDLSIDSEKGNEAVAEQTFTKQNKLYRTPDTMRLQPTDEELAYRAKESKGVNVLDDCASKLKCTKCSTSFKTTIAEGRDIFIHPLLKVLFCKTCCSFYGSGDFSLDEDDEDKYCRWCGEGGTLFLCSKCICGFCPKCIRRHFGKEKEKQVENDDDWTCFFCEPKPLWELRNISAMAVEKSRDVKNSANQRREARLMELKKKAKGGKDEKKKAPVKEDSSGASDSEKKKVDGSSSGSESVVQKKKKLKKKKSTKVSDDEDSSDEEEKNTKKRKRVSPPPNVTNGNEKDKSNGKASDESESSKQVQKRLKITIKFDDKRPNETELVTSKKRGKGSSSDDTENVKKKSKTDEENNITTELADDAKFIETKKQTLKKLKNILEITSFSASLCVDVCKKKLKKIGKLSRVTRPEKLLRECERLKAVIDCLSASLVTASNSMAALQTNLALKKFLPDASDSDDDKLKKAKSDVLRLKTLVNGDSDNEQFAALENVAGECLSIVNVVESSISCDVPTTTSDITNKEKDDSESAGEDVERLHSSGEPEGEEEKEDTAPSPHQQVTEDENIPSDAPPEQVSSVEEPESEKETKSTSFSGPTTRKNYKEASHRENETSKYSRRNQKAGKDENKDVGTDSEGSIDLPKRSKRRENTHRGSPNKKRNFRKVLTDSDSDFKSRAKLSSKRRASRRIGGKMIESDSLSMEVSEKRKVVKTKQESDSSDKDEKEMEPEEKSTDDSDVENQENPLSNKEETAGKKTKSKKKKTQPEEDEGDGEGQNQEDALSDKEETASKKKKTQPNEKVQEGIDDENQEASLDMFDKNEKTSKSKRKKNKKIRPEEKTQEGDDDGCEDNSGRVTKEKSCDIDSNKSSDEERQENGDISEEKSDAECSKGVKNRKSKIKKKSSNVETREKEKGNLPSESEEHEKTDDESEKSNHERENDDEARPDTDSNDDAYQCVTASSGDELSGRNKAVNGNDETLVMPKKRKGSKHTKTITLDGYMKKVEKLKELLMSLNEQDVETSQTVDLAPLLSVFSSEEDSDTSAEEPVFTNSQPEQVKGVDESCDVSTTVNDAIQQDTIAVEPASDESSDDCVLSKIKVRRFEESTFVDLEDEEEENSSKVKDVVENESDTEVGRVKNKKWKRLKGASDSSESDYEDRTSKSPKKGRKNINKILKTESLKVETKEAVNLEAERKKRLAERQAKYDKLFPAKENENRLVLDFDMETEDVVVSVHPKLVKKLKPHQKEGVKFMWDNCFESVQRMEKENGSGCILAHCMGLGKTLQVVTLVHTVLNHEIGVKTVLVVCPLNTVKNWISEFEMWLEKIKTEPITLYDSTVFKRDYDRKYQLKNWQKGGGVLVMSYDMFRNLLKCKRKNAKLNIYQQCLLNPGPDLVVCDEGHLLKNEETALSKCMRQIISSRRIVLTGTPLQNNLIEYHCMVQFIKPNILGTKKEFTNRFANPIQNGQFEDSTETDVKVMKRRSHVLHNMLDGCVQRFDYSVLTPFLPEKREYVMTIALTELQEKLYREYLYRNTSGGEVRGTLFSDYQALQRIWTHPRTLLAHVEKQAVQRRNRWTRDSDSEGSLKDFVVSGSEEGSTSDSEGDSVKSVKSGDDEATKKPSATKSTKRSLRSNTKPEELTDLTEIKDNQERQKEWWDEFVKEEDMEDIRHSGKLMVMLAILRESEAAGDKVLVFSQSLYSLDLIEYFLSKVSSAPRDGSDPFTGGYSQTWELGNDYFRLDGSTNSEQRSMWTRFFNKETNTRARLFLISTKAGGLGINLVSANRVIIFDASWNPSHDVQSIFRVYRFGQSKTCYIYRFLAEATMEEKIYERQVTKLSMACRVVDEQQIERHYAMSTLRDLYKYEPIPIDKRKTPLVPKDKLFATILKEFRTSIVNYHEHDSLLENKQEEELNEDERKAAWEDYESEKDRPPPPRPGLSLDPALLLQWQQQQAQWQQQAQKMQQINQAQRQVANEAMLRQLEIQFNIFQQGLLRGQIPPGHSAQTAFLNPLPQNRPQLKRPAVLQQHVKTIPPKIEQKGLSLGIRPMLGEGSEAFQTRIRKKEAEVMMQNRYRAMPPQKLQQLLQIQHQQKLAQQQQQKQVQQGQQRQQPRQWTAPRQPTSSRQQPSSKPQTATTDTDNDDIQIID